MFAEQPGRWGGNVPSILELEEQEENVMGV